MTVNPIRSICKFTILIVFLIAPNLLFSQVNVSDRFEKVLKEIVKEEVKAKIFKYTTKQDPIIGLITQNLVGQIIDMENEDVIMKTGLNVGLELVFLNYIRLQVEVLLELHPEVLDSAKRLGLKGKELIAYSSLYYYYSERIKYGLTIPPYIGEYSEVKTKIESVRNQEKTKFTTLISRRFVKAKREGDALFDVRFFEFIQKYCSEIVFNHEKAIENGPRMLKDLLGQIKYFKDEDWKRLVRNAPVYLKDKDSTLVLVTVLYDKILSQAFKTMPSQTKIDDTQLLRIKDLLTSDIKNILVAAANSYIDQEKVMYNFKASLLQLLDVWLDGVKNKPMRMAYRLTLSATPLFNDSTGTVDFTLMDQIRLYPFKNLNLFFFIGGFTDPILKSVLDDQANTIYPFGPGIDLPKGFSLSAVAGFPIQDITNLNWYYGFNLAYNIPLKYLLAK